MYSVKASEIPLEAKLFQDIWLLEKKYYKAQNTNEYFEALRADADQILKKYPTKKCHDMVWAIIHECERRAGIKN